MLYPMLICTFAGLSTAVGALPVVLGHKITTRKLALAQGFAAGVMLAVSVLDLLPESYGSYFVYMNSFYAFRAVASLFICGWVTGVAISGITTTEHYTENTTVSVRRMAFITTLVMVIHNLPEGMLTLFSSAHNIDTGIKMAVAVALHNMPEGLAIAAPVLYVTHSRGRAFMQALMAGMSEPLGALLAFFVLRPFITVHFLTGLMPVVAGIMCQAAICELIPQSLYISKIQHSLCGIITGIIAMSIGLFVF